MRPKWSWVVLPFTVVLDPGHGGSDLGARVHTASEAVIEKDVTLKIAREVARNLRARGIRAVLTREKDEEVSLGARTAIANRLKADVFLSIHMNSNESGSQIPEGVETYFLNTTTDASSKRLAKLENSVMDGGEHSNVALILKDLRLDANLAESKRLACGLQAFLVDTTQNWSPTSIAIRDRGVKQALFHVLLGADMPSALVEVGFLTSQYDRRMLQHPVGVRHTAQAIATAVDYYRKNRGTARARELISKCNVRNR